MATREQWLFKRFVAGLDSMEWKLDELDRSIDRMERALDEEELPPTVSIGRKIKKPRATRHLRLVVSRPGPKL